MLNLRNNYVKLRLVVLNFVYLLSFSAEVSAQTIQIKHIKIEGNTVFPKETIENLFLPYRNQEFDSEDLEQLTNVITNLYIGEGYISSGAFLPEQEFVDGIVTIEISEGKLEDIEIEGLKRLKESYILSKLQKLKQEVFNFYKLQEALETIQTDPLVENVKADLNSGTTVSNRILLLEIKEAPLIQGRLAVNDRATPSTGEIKGVGTLIHRNLLGLRDRAFFQYDFTEGLSSYELNYTIPLNYNGTAISVGYRDNESRISQDPFAQIDINAQADTISLKLIQEITRSQTEEFYVTVIFDQSVSKTFIGDIPFPFADGTDDGLSRLSVFRLKGDWLKRSNKSVISLISQLSLGIDLFDATVNDDAPDGLFLAWLGQLQFATVLDKEQDIVFITRLSTQLAFDSLLPFEKIAVGGVDTVRGYPNNGFLGDNAVLGTFELGFTALEDEDLGRLKISPFLDVGIVWNTNGDFSQSLASLGVRLDWQLKDSVFFRFDYGISLIDVPERGDSLSNNNFSFSVEINF